MNIKIDKRSQRTREALKKTLAPNDDKTEY